MSRRRPPRSALAWLGCGLLLAGCQSAPTSVPHAATPNDFFQAKAPDSAGPIRLANYAQQDSTPIENLLKLDDAKPAPPAKSSTPDPTILDPQSLAAACPALAVHGLGGDMPRELAKVVIPDYIIEPPDILLVEAIPSLPDQPVQGEHLVRPDGTINLGTYGSVHLAGLTLDQARAVIKEQLSQYIKNVKLNVDIFAYNSKKIYIIADGAGFGQQVVPIPFTGNDTVLDAISQIGGLPVTASKKKIWVARPGPDDSIQTLPVDWKGITQDGLARTNYQLFPGDRIYIQSDRLMALDGVVTKILTPVERVFGTTYLGARTIFQLQNMGRGVAAGGGF